LKGGADGVADGGDGCFDLRLLLSAAVRFRRMKRKNVTQIVKMAAMRKGFLINSPFLKLNFFYSTVFYPSPQTITIQFMSINNDQ